MQPVNSFDRLAGLHAARLTPGVGDALRQDDRRIVITGASGWIGRATLALLAHELGEDELRRRLHCFGSQQRILQIEPGLAIEQKPLARLAELPCEPTLLFHLAFLTKDRVAGMDQDQYRQANLQLTQTVAGALDSIGVDRLFVASSGAAAFADDPQSAEDLRLYGQLKLDDEQLFAAWASEQPDRHRAVITRIFSLSGPHINKFETYALASFILDAIGGRPVTVRAPMRVVRSYVAIRELVSLLFSLLLSQRAETVTRFDSGGQPMELEEVALEVARLLGPVPVNRAPITVERPNHYAGDTERYRQLLVEHGIEAVPFDAQIAETAAYILRQTTKDGRLLGWPEECGHASAPGPAIPAAGNLSAK